MFITCCLYCFAFVAFSNIAIADDLLKDSRHKLHPVPNNGTGYKRIKRIVNGREIASHSRPYLVYLEDVTNGILYCGGTILDANTILTAAHCYNRNQVYVVVAGAHDKRVNEETKQRRDVKAVYIHEQYDRSNARNDIAILKLASPLSLDRPEVRSVSMNTDASCPVTDSFCHVTGWGRIRKNGPPSNVPLEVNIKVISNSNCYYNTRYYSRIFDTNICAGGDTCTNTLYEDSCEGDSGGPLTCVYGGEYKVAGIVSWGIGCGQLNCPGVYTRVSSYINWINEKRTSTVPSGGTNGDPGNYPSNYGRTSGSGNFLQGSVQRSTIITIVIFVFRL